MPVMSEALISGALVRAMGRFMLLFFAVAVIVAVALFASDRVSLGVSVLVSPVLVGALALRWRRKARVTAPKRPRRSGVFIMATVGAMPGAVLIFVGILVGGGVGNFSVAMGASLIGMAGLILAMVRSIPVL
jgi:hypothetical protein